MTREEAIQRIVWCLLRYADSPGAAVATVLTLKACLGDGHEQQMTLTNLLRAAGLFAKDDDGYFMRYRNEMIAADQSLLAFPQPNIVVTFPVPSEPRMRIAYTVFNGLLLKHLYHSYGAVPTEVKEGVARLVVNKPLPENNTLWNEFKNSSLAACAVEEGLEATLGAVGNIGSIDVTETIAGSALLDSFLTVLPRFVNKFQSQGGMRLDFYFAKDVDEWLAQRDSASDSGESLPDLWRLGWKEGSLPRVIASQIAVRIVRNLKRDEPLPARTFRVLWVGEGSGANRKRGMRDGLPRTTVENARRAKSVDDEVLGLLSQLDGKRQNTRALHKWVKLRLNKAQYRKWLEKAIATLRAALASDTNPRTIALDATSLLEDMVTEFGTQTIVPSLRKKAAGHNREVRNAIRQTAGLCIALRLAEVLDQRPHISIFGWRVETLRRVQPKQEWALRFLKKRKPAGGMRIIEVRPFGNIERLPVYESEEYRPPFQCFVLDGGLSPVISEPVMSEQRCIVCGSSLDLLVGKISFLPENKKRFYDIPTRKEFPSFCSNCAFIAYLSSVYPSSDLSIVEFPSNNFLELFALHEKLQGVSALMALKYINRIASLSVLPNRYLLLSHRDGKGRMDGKVQVYLQLRQQAHLLKYVARPMRVQIEGGIPQMWSEIQTHIPIGLSHFKNLPPYYETQDSGRKAFAYEVVRALEVGQPYKALYVAAKYAENKGSPFEGRVFSKNLGSYEVFVSENCTPMAKSLGGEIVSDEIYQDIKEFSDHLFDILNPLVRREVQKSGSSVSGIARKYTDLIQREFAEGMVGKFLYAVCQEADSAERDGDGWVKHNTFTKLYGASPDIKGKTAGEIAHVWEEFRKSHPLEIEIRLGKQHSKHGAQHAIWQKFLREVQARTLALLMLNVRQKS